MSYIRYRDRAPGGIGRMIIKPTTTDRPSLGMTEVKGEIYYLSPELIIPYKNQARKEINDDTLADLVASVQSQGIIQPLQLIPSTDNKGKFEVVSGERRLRAAIKIGLGKVPCIILDRDRDADEIALIENIQREDLHPIELAEAVSTLLDGKKYGNQKEFGERIGISKSQISHLLAISRLPEDVKQHLLTKRGVKISLLRKIAYLKNEHEMRERVFNGLHEDKKYKSIMRISFNGKEFRFDQLKIDHLSPSENSLLKEHITAVLEKKK